jgi:hypothetical protein
MNRVRWIPMLLLAGGCAASSGTLTVEGIPADPPPRQQFVVWHNDTTHFLRHVKLDGDTLRGRPYGLSRSTDPRPVAIPRAEVDSISYREPTGEGAVLAVGVTTFVLVKTGLFLWFFFLVF